MTVIDEIDAIEVKEGDKEDVSERLIRYARRAIIPLSLMELQSFDFLPRDWDVLEHILAKAGEAKGFFKEELLDSATNIKLGNLLYCKNEFDGSVDHYRRALDIDDLPVARKNLGIALLAGNHVEEARKVFEEAVEKVYDDHVLWFYLGLSYEYGEEGRYRDEDMLRKVLHYYDRSLELKPDFGPAQYNKGLVLSLLGRKEEAQELITAWLKENPGSPAGWCDRGLLLRAVGDLEGALKCYENAINLKPDFDLAWLNKSVALFGATRYEESLEAIEKALELNPDSDIALTNKGAVLSELGRYDEAVICYDRALELNPGFEGAIKNRAKALAAIERRESEQKERKG
jgi:tetratricopeptide (TPR) repeat protein